MIWPLKWIFESAGLCMFTVGELMTTTGMILGERRREWWMVDTRRDYDKVN